MKNIFSKISFKAVVIGALADVVGTNIWTVFLVIYLVAVTHTHPASSSEIMEALNGSMVLKVLNWIIGGAFSVLGGYVAARISKQHILLNATLASFLCILSGVYALTSVMTAYETLLVILAIVLNPALALMGGYIYKLRNSH
jgi:hypothetical protein